MDIVASQTQSCLESTQRFTDYNQNRDSIPLSKKYFIICEISSCLSSDEKNKFLTSCQNLAKQRIFHEDDFTQGVILVQANQAMTTSFNAYANGYLTNTRMNQFLEKTVLMTK